MSAGLGERRATLRSLDESRPASHDATAQLYAPFGERELALGVVLAETTAIATPDQHSTSTSTKLSSGKRKKCSANLPSIAEGDPATSRGPATAWQLMSSR